MSRLTHYYIYPTGTCIRSINGKQDEQRIVGYPEDWHRDIVVTDQNIITSSSITLEAAIEEVRAKTEKYFSDRADEYVSYEYEVTVIATVIADNWSLEQAKSKLPVVQFVQLCEEVGIQPIVAV